MQIHCIDNETEFLALSGGWEKLRLSLGASYFLSHEWIRCCWQELKSNNRMRVFVGFIDGYPVMIAPLMLSRISTSKLPATSLTCIEHPETQVSDIMMAQSLDGKSALNSLFSYLLTQRASEWSLLSLDKLPSDSLVANCLRLLKDESVYCTELEASHQSLILPLSGSWDEYWAKQPVRFRKTLRNVANRTQNLGAVEVKTYAGKATAEEAIRKLFVISDSSWKAADGVAITSSKGRMRFFKELSAGLISAEGVRIIILEVDGKAIASETQIMDGAVVYALRSDYDETFAASSPGTFLQMEILKELFDGPYKEYNFGVGLNPYKGRWAKEHRQLVRFRLYNATLYGRLLHTVDRCEPKLSQLPGVRVLNSLFSGNS